MFERLFSLDHPNSVLYTSINFSKKLAIFQHLTKVGCCLLKVQKPFEICLIY